MRTYRGHLLSALMLTMSFILLLPEGQAVAADWKIAGDLLKTRWANDVTLDNVHSEYPRPQMVRRDWKNLNGLWDYAIKPKNQPAPKDYDGQILVPFCVESAMSGVMKTVGPRKKLWYRRTFIISADWKGNNILLHFGAVDFEASVTVNGKKLGTHKGGFDPFTFDITDALKKGDNELIVEVFDPTNAGKQPCGKQVLTPGGIFYTAVTGIWQTVWLEPVSADAHITNLKITPDVDNSTITIEPSYKAKVGVEWPGIKVEVLDDGKMISSGSFAWSKPIKIKIDNPKLWSPDSPHLYDVKIKLGNDKVRTYFGMRKIALAKDADGINRRFLNNKPLFQYGTLDQGYWPDGLFTAPTDEALKYDLDITKELGFNMVRKHVKIEPARFYYHCDKLGLLVWQDMPTPTGDKYIIDTDPDMIRAKEDADQFNLELKRMVDTFYNYPSVVMWVCFNEGRAQFDTGRITNWLKEYDPTRLVDTVSGWTDRGIGDVRDMHAYPGPAKPANEEKRAVVLGEFGGLGLLVKGHHWSDKGYWGYSKYEDSEALTDAYVGIIQKMRPLIHNGLAAAVYTQTTDIEVELNGLITYDRELIKMDAAKVTAVNKKLYLPPPVKKSILPDASTGKTEWRYTTDKPAGDFQNVDFDDSAWKVGTGGFGRKGTKGSLIGTEWNKPDIWLRREFEITKADAAELFLNIQHDEDATVYINGTVSAKVTGYTTSYTLTKVSNDALKTIKPGKNIIAVHCHNNAGGQSIDVGLIELIEQ